MNKQGEKVEYERKIYSLKKEVKRKKKYDNYRHVKKKEETKQKAHMANIVKKEKKKMEYDKDRYIKKRIR